MATKIRLKRIGRKNKPFYRIVVIDSRKRRDGAAIEELGWYNPIPKEFTFNIKEDRILYWLGEGAQPSDTVMGLFRRSGLTYKWELTNKGFKETKIEELLTEWKERQKNREELKVEKSKTKK